MKYKISMYKLYKKTNINNNSFYKSPIVYFIVWIIAITTDATNMYELFDYYLSQTVLISVMITCICSICMNTLPTMVADLINDRDDKSKQKKVVLTVLVSLFTILQISVFTLRWVSRGDILTGSGEILNLGNSFVQTENQTSNTAQNVCALILGLEPLATSILLFAMKYESNPQSVKIKSTNLQIAKLKDMRNQLILDNLEVSLDREHDFDSDDMSQMQSTLKKLESAKKEMKYYSNQLLAEKLKTADSVSYLLKGSKKEENYND